MRTARKQRGLKLHGSMSRVRERACAAASEQREAARPPRATEVAGAARRRTSCWPQGRWAAGAGLLMWCLALAGSGPADPLLAARGKAPRVHFAAMHLRGAGTAVQRTVRAEARGPVDRQKAGMAEGSRSGLPASPPGLMGPRRDESHAVSEVTSSDGPEVPGTHTKTHAFSARGVPAEQGCVLVSSVADSPTLTGLDGRRVYLPWVLDGPGCDPGARQENSRSPSPASERHLSSVTSTVTGAAETPPGQQRMQELFRPTPFSMWANDAVRICMIRNSSDLKDPTRQFQPLFTHQVFGLKEEIIGFENPAVQIVYAANTLRPSICFGARENVERQQLKDHGLQRTDVLDAIRKHAPADYSLSTDEVLQDASECANDRPLGTVLWRYTSQQPRHNAPGYAASWIGGRPQSMPEVERKHSSSSEFRVYLTDFKSDAARVLLQRVQSLAIWLIERASYIKPDDNWQLLTLYEHDGRLQAGETADGDVDLEAESSGGGGAQFVGFVTLYKDHNLLAGGRSRSRSRSQSHPSQASRSPCSSPGGMKQEDTVENMDRDSAAEDASEPKFRLRISQFVILPHYQRRGHGEQVLRAIYSLGRSIPQCVEVCVENPSPGFSKLRDKTDARVLQELGLFEDLQIPNPDWDKLAATLKWARTQLRHLHASVVRRVVKSLQSQLPDGSFPLSDSRSLLRDEGSLCEVDGKTFYAKEFAIVRGPDEKRLLAQLLGINPTTKLLRVRWIYQWEDVPQDAMTQSSRRWRALLTPGMRRKASSSNPQREVFFVFHEDFIHHQALVDKCVVRFLPPEGTSTIAEDLLDDKGGASVFMCRFVFDPQKRRILSLRNKLIKTRYRRILDSLIKEQHEKWDTTAHSIRSRSNSGDAQADPDASDGAVSVSGMGSAAHVPISGHDVSLAGWQMAPYDLSSVAYSDSLSGSGSYPEIVPYSPLGVGFERKESRERSTSSAFKLANSFRRAASRHGLNSPLSPDGLVSWNGLRIRQVRRKVLVRSGSALRRSQPRLLGNGRVGSGGVRTSPKKGGGVTGEKEKKQAPINAKELSMLPAALTALLSPGTARDKGAAQSARPTEMMPKWQSVAEADRYAHALLQCADRLEACLADVRMSVSHSQPQPRAQTLLPSTKENEMVPADKPEPQPHHAGNWLSQTMAWLRGSVTEESAPAQEEIVRRKKLPGPPVAIRTGTVGDDAVNDIDDESKHVTRAVEIEVLKGCEHVLRRLAKRVDSHIFLQPVDPERHHCPDYFTIISHPMDLGTVGARLSAGEYCTASGMGGHLWFADVKLTFANAQTYNPCSHPVHRQASKLAEAFADGYAGVLSKTATALRRFGEAKQERWRLTWAAILRELVQHPQSLPFLEPVDPVALEIPDYLDIVMAPMDLGTIGQALQGMAYASGQEVAAHVNLTFDNAMLYNPKGHPIHAQAAELKRLAAERWRAAAAACGLEVHKS